MSAPELRVVEDPARACADALLEAVAAGGHVVLTGGTTPRRAYELAARDAERFRGARLWFGDERCVGPDDENSNYRMARQTLLDPLASAGVEIDFCRRIEGELGPEEAAQRYEAALAEAGAPPFSLLLLGLGSDGHTASMFPRQPSLRERDRLVVGVGEAGLEPYVPRVTMTFPAIAGANHVLLVATGASKAEPVRRAFGPDARPTPEVPGSLIAEHASRFTVLLDAEAAAGL